MHALTSVGSWSLSVCLSVCVRIAVSRLSCSRLPDFVTAEDDSDTDEKSDDDQAGTCDKQAVYLEAMMHPVGASRSVWWSEGEGEGDSGGDNVAEGRRRYDDEKGCQVEHQILHKDHFDLVFNPGGQESSIDPSCLHLYCVMCVCQSCWCMCLCMP